MQPAPDTERRLALLVATSLYSDPGLRELRAPGSDATELAHVLRDPRIGGFDVQMLVNAASGEAQEEIEDFCADRHPGDQLLIYLSCHGVLDSHGRLYYAAANTRRERLAATAIGSAWLNERLDDCRARSQILVLDCCHSGAFARGAKGDAELALQQRFEPKGRGRVVLTASRSTEYSFEGDQATGEGVPSVFTNAIVNGLRTGDADGDKDGLITVTDLYHYVYNHVREAEPRQTPELWTYGAEGSLLVAHSIRGAIIQASKPSDLFARAVTRIAIGEANKRGLSQALMLQREQGDGYSIEIVFTDEAEREAEGYIRFDYERLVQWSLLEEKNLSNEIIADMFSRGPAPTADLLEHWDELIDFIGAVGRGLYPDSVRDGKFGISANTEAVEIGVPYPLSVSTVVSERTRERLLGGESVPFLIFSKQELTALVAQSNIVASKTVAEWLVAAWGTPTVLSSARS